MLGKFFGSFVFVICLVVDSLYGRKVAPRWWNSVQLLPRYQDRSLTMDKLPITCSEIPGLVPQQLRYCRDHLELLGIIIKGAKLGINECKFQFKERRWNCSTTPLVTAHSFKRRSIFGRTVDKGTREGAFLRAIITAGVVYAITKECSADHLTSCGCGSNTGLPIPPKEHSQHDRQWRWGGCNEDVDYGIRVTNNFVDPHLEVTNARSQMNKHNNDVGRQVLRNNMWLKCKCHGLSGSCEMETCWRSMPNFRRVGSILKQRYDDVFQVKVEKHKMTSGRVEMIVPKLASQPYPGSQDLIYVDASPNFCVPNRKRGVRGTQGRRCDATAKGLTSCDHLCCGRGYETKIRTHTRKCNCTFHWCCHVTCDNCKSQVQIQSCL